VPPLVLAWPELDAPGVGPVAAVAAGPVVVGVLAGWLEAPFPELVTGVALDAVELAVDEGLMGEVPTVGDVPAMDAELEGFITAELPTPETVAGSSAVNVAALG